MSGSARHNNPLKHRGSSQRGRMLSAMDPENVELHGLKEEEWLQFAYEYARLINYFPPDDPDHPKGNWQSFFEPEKDIETLMNRYGNGDTEPHMALFISFLKLLTHPQKSLNQLPKRHLDFYYQQVLQLKKKPFEPDRVHVIFELAKNAKETLVDAEVPLKAGKDSEGNPLTYKTTNSLVVNPAKVAALKSVFVDNNAEGKDILRYAPVVNSADGMGEEPEDGQSWSAFGKSGWPEAELGFYVASQLLLLKEGERTIRLMFKIADGLSIPKNHIQAFVTGGEEWMQASLVSVDTSEPDFNFILELHLDSEADPVVSYSEKIHEAVLTTDKPCVKILFTEPADYQKLKNAKIEQLKLEVAVEGVESLQLQNELGNLDPSKPFMPFGSRPKVGSKLKISYPELYHKPISEFELGMRWLNVPANFSEHYKQYQSAINLQKGIYILYMAQIVSYSYAGLTMLSEPSNGSSSPEDPPPDTMRDDFQVKVTSPFNPDPDGDDTERHILFSSPPQVSVEVPGDPVSTAKGEIEMILTESFYHDLYTELYVNAVLGANGSADLPNEPYTPLLDQLTLNYTASGEVSFAGETESVMFHRHPFGAKQVTGGAQTIVPKYENSELYIGLENMTAGNNISLLFQVAEGSENPAHSSFNEGDIDWWVLSENNWLKIDDSDFARNQTNNFLRSGIVEVPVSVQADTSNKILNEELHWLRVRLKNREDSVCRFINVHAQASEAVFDNQGNTTDHLDDGLPPESIGQLVHAKSRIKSVSQPYASFEGEPAEADSAFYRRISERLRHKHRAVTIWDYEHLLLEEFPSLYKVKCLNHTHWDGTNLDEMSPGNVTMVLIPNITSANKEFRLKPMVSQNFKDRVETFVNRQNSMHAVLKATNAVYERVRFEFSVQFHTGLDFNFYRSQTNEDLKKLLAPWVFESEAAIKFGGSFSEYQVVNYLENLDYVDFITDFRMFHQPLNGEFTRKTTVEPSNALAILVPVDEHEIKQAEKCE